MTQCIITKALVAKIARLIPIKNTRPVIGLSLIIMGSQCKNTNRGWSNRSSTGKSFKLTLIKLLIMMKALNNRNNHHTCWMLHNSIRQIWRLSIYWINPRKSRGYWINKKMKRNTTVKANRPIIKKNTLVWASGKGVRRWRRNAREIKMSWW